MKRSLRAGSAFRVSELSRLFFPFRSGVTLLEGGGKRPCCVPFIADLVVGRGYRLVFSDLQGGGAMSYGVGDVRRLPKSGMHPFGSVTNGLVRVETRIY